MRSVKGDPNDTPPTSYVGVAAQRGSIEALMQELLRIEEKDAFDLATRTNPGLLSRNDFLSLFLEAENMDSKRGAERLVAYFEQKLEIWGSDWVHRDLTVSDLSAEDIDALADGAFEFIPRESNDESALLVINFWNLPHDSEKAWSLIRAFWYLSSIVAAQDAYVRNIEAGVAVVGIHLAEKETDDAFSRDSQLAKQLADCFCAFPIRVASVQEIFLGVPPSHDNVFLNTIANFYQVSTQTFSGTLNECAKWLISKDLPLSALASYLSHSNRKKLSGRAPGLAELLQIRSNKKQQEEQTVTQLQPLTIGSSSAVSPQQQGNNVGMVGQIGQFLHQPLGHLTGGTGSSIAMINAPGAQSSQMLSNVLGSSGHHASGDFLGMISHPVPVAFLAPPRPVALQAGTQSLSGSNPGEPRWLSSANTVSTDNVTTTPSVGAAQSLPTTQGTQDDSTDIDSAKRKPSSALPGEAAPKKRRAIVGTHTGKGKIIRPPMCLSVPSDTQILSKYQTLVREQLEVFAADADDVQHHISKLSKPLALGQVGIRCRHCAALPQYSRPKGAVYYPKDLNSLYQFGQNMIKNHLCHSCGLLPDDIKVKMTGLQVERRRGRGGRDQWVAAAKELGIGEDEDGLCFL